MINTFSSNCKKINSPTNITNLFKHRDLRDLSITRLKALLQSTFLEDTNTVTGKTSMD